MNAHEMVIYVDIDDTLVRSFGTKRIPMTTMIEQIRKLHADGAKLYAWSSAGGDYAHASAIDFGIESCFVAFLPKPHVMIDDQPVSEWRRTIHVHPGRAASCTVADYLPHFA